MRHRLDAFPKQIDAIYSANFRSLKVSPKMATHSNKCSYICFGLILMGIASWKHFFDLLQWSQDMSSNYFVRHRQRYEEYVRVWQIESNCGVRHTCPENSFPIFLSTAASTDNQPRLCVAGKYVIKPKEKEEGRGLNAAIVESSHFKVISVRNFDTYLYNKSAEIADWIEGVLETDILIIFTSDEASARLSGETKNLLNELGSGKIQNLQYRSQWFMITQKGTPGFTTYEKITYSKKKSWGDTIEFRGCVPQKIPKKITTADEPLKQNRKKTQFCVGKNEEKFKGFCNEPRFEIIMPALVTNKSLLENSAYSLPIFVFASKDLEVLISSLDNMIHQPGVVVSLITVLYENNDSEVSSLTKIYGMHSKRTKFGRTFEERLRQARQMTKKLYPKKKYLIVLDSGVIPSPDFLYFFAQTLPVLEKDNTVSTITGWSSNCYRHNGSLHLAYRINGVPKYAALISAEDKRFSGEMFAPDVARLQGTEVCHLPSLNSNNWIERPQNLLKDRYFHKLVMLQQLGQVVEEEDILSSCSHFAVKNQTNVIYVQSKQKSLPKILHCLGVLKNHYGEYNGIVRLFVEGKAILIITSESPFYKSRPIPLELNKDNVKTSAQIGLPYSPARTITYERIPLMRLPRIRVQPAYREAAKYTPHEGLKSTYRETYKIPIAKDNFNTSNLKMPKEPKEYTKWGKQSKPIKYGMTEYKNQFGFKEAASNAQGISVEKTTTCPMVLTGRDERDPLPLTNNYGKYVDIYLSTTRSTHRTFTFQEQRTLAAKDIVTSQETMNIPKGRGFGCKFPAFSGQDLDNRDKNMIDKVTFSSEHKLRFVPKGMPRVPNFGSETEVQAAYKRPSGVAVPHLFDRFIEFPVTVSAPTAKQTLCPPGMYAAESSVIHSHTSPQTVV